jgi:hypothetical protein
VRAVEATELVVRQLPSSEDMNTEAEKYLLLRAINKQCLVKS